MYNGTVLKNKSLDSLNLDRNDYFDVIVTKEKLKLLPREYITIECVKFCVADLKRNNCGVYA